jgi:antitoxin component of RelBE/YafQ-DinJ toxin-antitoxin module
MSSLLHCVDILLKQINKTNNIPFTMKMSVQVSKSTTRKRLTGEDETKSQSTVLDKTGLYSVHSAEMPEIHNTGRAVERM